MEKEFDVFISKIDTNFNKINEILDKCFIDLDFEYYYGNGHILRAFGHKSDTKTVYVLFKEDPTDFFLFLKGIWIPESYEVSVETKRYTLSI